MELRGVQERDPQLGQAAAEDRRARPRRRRPARSGPRRCPEFPEAERLPCLATGTPAGGDHDGRGGRDVDRVGPVAAGPAGVEDRPAARRTAPSRSSARGPRATAPASSSADSPLTRRAVRKAATSGLGRVARHDRGRRRRGPGPRSGPGPSPGRPGPRPGRTSRDADLERWKAPSISRWMPSSRPVDGPPGRRGPGPPRRPTGSAGRRRSGSRRAAGSRPASGLSGSTFITAAPRKLLGQAQPPGHRRVERHQLRAPSTEFGRPGQAGPAGATGRRSGPCRRPSPSSAISRRSRQTTTSADWPIGAIETRLIRWFRSATSTPLNRRITSPTLTPARRGGRLRGRPTRSRPPGGGRGPGPGRSRARTRGGA